MDSPRNSNIQNHPTYSMQDKSPTNVVIHDDDSHANPDSLTEAFYYIFNKSTFILILWFLGIYFVAYFGLGYFFNKGGETSSFELRLSRILDIFFLFILLLFLLSFYYSNSGDQQQTLVSSIFTSIGNYIYAPLSIITTTLILIIFYICVYLFRVPMTAETKPIFISIFENILWVLLVIIIFVDFFKYVVGITFNFNFWNLLPDESPRHIVVDSSNNNVAAIPNNKIDSSNNNIDSSNNKIDSSNNVIPQKNEVFNISNNLYTYDDAQSICAAYGATLATYDQIEDAYNKGGEWCNYGWSDGQAAYFPTQKDTWNKLQKTTKHKNDCGRPGVNGGYMANPNFKFGVNCYGKKPLPSEADLERLSAPATNDTVYPKSKEDLELEAKIKYWKDNAAQLLKLNSFNTKQWSEY